MSNTSEDTRLTTLEQRVTLLQQETLSPYQTFLLLALQTVLPAYGAIALVTASVRWWQESLTAALATMQLFVDLTVATLMVLAVVLWIGIRIGKRVTR